MEKDKIREIINSLIQLSQEKFGLLKVGKNTLNEDILFIEKYTLLKEALNIESFDGVDLTDFPEMIQLKIMIKEIHESENSKQNKHKKLNQALKAYKK